MRDEPVLPPADAPVTGLERHILAQCMDSWPHLHPGADQCVLGYLDANEEVAGLSNPVEIEAVRRHQRELQARLEIYTERRLGHS